MAREAKEPLNEEQKVFIHDNYLKKSMMDIADDIDSTYHYVRTYMRKNNLVVPRSVVSGFQQKKINSPNYKREKNPYRIQ